MKYERMEKKVLVNASGHITILISDFPNERTQCIGLYNYFGYNDEDKDVIRNFRFSFLIERRPTHAGSPLVGIWRFKEKK